MLYFDENLESTRHFSRESNTASYNVVSCL